MKKVIAISLVVVHLFFVTGIKVSMHFCADTLKSVSIGKTSAETESCCKPSTTHSSKEDTCKKASCCEDTSATLLALSSYGNETIHYIAPAVVASVEVFDNSLATASINALFPQALAPPIFQGRALYLTTSSFCFYG
jgi:hypothetical protein